MSKTTIIVLGVVAVAGVGGFLYYQHSKAQAAALAAVKAKSSPSGGGSTTDKIFGAITAAIPLAQKITELWD